ncbi:DUF2975 domain-containing protein [Streptomyces albofaciens JCM 4342]|uniref:DUF2975 domain-containing protein n=1 Tax=Streptomyces albofaciens TaxID=66866 RepID=UPI001238BE56|nr:DUF2975 domain-containing protein [Streptomyces albofaciens]KAA6214806.1 DUF2975 domain-containing protein [Streptomyces albofaciens JCM 4342]
MRHWWTRAADYVLELILGAALLLVGLFHIVFPVLGVAGPWASADSREVRVDAAARLPGGMTSTAMTLRGSDRAELVLADPGLGQRLLLVLPVAVGGLLLVVVLAVLLRMARTFRDGDFFVPENTRRLTVVAVALMLLGVLVPLLYMMTTNLLVRGEPMAAAIAPAQDYAVLPVFLAILAAAAAAAFRNGTRLRADTEGLV